MRTLSITAIVLTLPIAIYLVSSAVIFDKKYGDIYTENPMQMSRMDLSCDIEEGQVKEVIRFLRSMEGIGHTYYNAKDQILVFSHRPDLISATDAFQKLKEKTDLEFSLYEVPDHLETSGCPVTGPSTYTMQVGQKVWKLFN